MIPAARKFDAKKEVDTARAAFTSFFVARFPWGDFSGAFSVGVFRGRLDDAAPVGDHAPPPLLSGQAEPRRRPAPGR